MNRRCLGRNQCQKEPRLGANHQPSIADKLKVGRGAVCKDLAQELARRVPNVDSVAASCVHVALAVAVNAFCHGQFLFPSSGYFMCACAGGGRTVRDAVVGKCKGHAVLECAVLCNIEAVAAEGVKREISIIL